MAPKWRALGPSEPGGRKRCRLRGMFVYDLSKLCALLFLGKNECYVVKAVREVSIYWVFVLFTCFYGQRSFDTGFMVRLMELVEM